MRAGSWPAGSKLLRKKEPPTAPSSAEPVQGHLPDPPGQVLPPAAAALVEVQGAGIAGAGWGSEGAGREPEGLGPRPTISMDDLDFYYDGGGRTEEQIGPDDWPGLWPTMAQHGWSGAAGAGWDGGKAAGGEAAVWGVLQQVVDQLGQLRQQVGQRESAVVVDFHFILLRRGTCLAISPLLVPDSPVRCSTPAPVLSSSMHAPSISNALVLLNHQRQSAGLDIGALTQRLVIFAGC